MPRIAIVGAGIVGSSTAYYLTQHPKYSKDVEIVIIEASSPAAGASGKAGGLLSRQAFPSSIAPLSYKLHKQLAEKYNGAENWGFRNINVVSLEASTDHKDSKTWVPEDLDWIDNKIVTSVDVLGKAGDWSQVHPFQFTNFVLDEAKSAGVKLIHGKVTAIKGNDQPTQVVYEQSPGTQQVLDVDKVIVTAGPWTGRVMANAPVVGLKANSILIDTKQKTSAYAMFTELDVEGSFSSPEIYARKDEIYVCGATTSTPLPDLASSVEPDLPECDTLFDRSGVLSPVIKLGTLKKKQACYLPVVESPTASGPFIGETNVRNLYVAAGHTVWGINNGPATGLLMAEMLLDGAAKSANVKSLSPKGHFDATPTLEA